MPCDTPDRSSALSLIATSVIILGRPLFNNRFIFQKRGIVHCDLKPENILFVSEDDDSIVKVADFGFAQVLMGETKLVERLGFTIFIVSSF